MPAKQKVDVRQIVTDLILAKLEESTIPWRKPFTATAGDGAHRNLMSKKAYRGINPFLLDCQGYAQPWWLTMNQCNKLGGQVRKGEKSTIVVFNSPVERKCAPDAPGARVGPKGPVQTIWLMRYYRVFNVEQCDGIEERVPQPDPDAVTDPQPVELTTHLTQWMEDEGVKFRPNFGDPAYAPKLDTLIMPRDSAFDSPEDYALTLAHECIHASGHEDRLARDGVVKSTGFGSERYAKEELIAELGAAMVGAQFRIGSDARQIDNRAAYIASWQKAIADDKYLITSAASAAQKAADFLAPLAAFDGEPEPEAADAEAAYATR